MIQNNEINKTKKIAKFGSELNKVSFAKLSVQEMSIFVALICTTHKEELTAILEKREPKQEFILTFDEIKEIIGWTKRDKNAFAKLLRQTNKTLIQSFTEIGDDMEWEFVTLFNRFKASVPDRTLMVAVNPYFKYLLFGLTNNWTGIDVENFLRLTSVYSRRFFPQFMQWHTTGTYYVSTEEFVRTLGVPDTYKQSHIKANVIEPILAELKDYNLTYEVITELPKGLTNELIKNLQNKHELKYETNNVCNNILEKVTEKNKKLELDKKDIEVIQKVLVFMEDKNYKIPNIYKHLKEAHFPKDYKKPIENDFKGRPPVVAYVFTFKKLQKKLSIAEKSIKKYHYQKKWKDVTNSTAGSSTKTEPVTLVNQATENNKIILNEETRNKLKELLKQNKESN